MKAAASSKRDAGFGGGSVGKSLSAQHSAKAAADFYGSGGIGRGWEKCIQLLYAFLNILHYF